MKKIEVNLDYKKVLENRSNEVYLAASLQAPKLENMERGPVAFCVCLDRSGSMQGQKFEYAKEACVGVVKSLQEHDFFSLVTFDSEIELVFPMGRVESKEETIEIIKSLEVRGMTNLSGGWEESRHQLRKAEKGMLRRMLLLSDGMANQGTTRHEDLVKLAGDGLREDEVCTTCLGFGDHYNEDLLRDMASHATGNFYDVDTADKLPAVFAAELESALYIAVKKMRVQFRPGKMCKEWKFLGVLPTVEIADGWSEFLMGDLSTEESRAFAMRMKFGPMTKGAKAMDIKFVYELVTDDGTEERVETKKVMLEVTTDRAEVIRNLDTMKIVSSQRSAEAIREAITLMDEAREADALTLLREMLAEFQSYNQPELVGDAISALEGMIKKIQKGWLLTRGRKVMSYSSNSFAKMSSKEVWSVTDADMSMPSFKESSLSDYGYKNSPDDEL